MCNIKHDMIYRRPKDWKSCCTFFMLLFWFFFSVSVMLSEFNCFLLPVLLPSVWLGQGCQNQLAPQPHSSRTAHSFSRAVLHVVATLGCELEQALWAAHGDIWCALLAACGSTPTVRGSTVSWGWPLKVISSLQALSFTALP